jgi:CubicO group peptidase (beta-lactamase class C family)
VRDHIFAPLHMNDTGFAPESDHVAGLAPGYTWKDDAWVSNADTLPWRGTSAGGGYSTVEDFLKFAQALEAGTLLPKALEAEALKPQNHAGWSGYGFSLRTDPPAPYYGHSGGAPGMNGELRIYPGQGVVFIGLGNLDGPGTGSTILANFYRLRMPLAP